MTVKNFGIGVVAAILLFWSASLANGQGSSPTVYTISTVAGSGTQGYGGDGGAATAASLNDPAGVALDTQGNLYIADANNNCIRKVTPDGKISTVAGNGTQGYGGDGGAATAASLNDPAGVALDAQGSFYIADGRNYRIRKVTPDGKISTVAGDGTGGYRGDGGAATAASLSYTAGVALDTQGNLYIADQQNNRIREVTQDGKITTVAGNGTQGYGGDGGAATAASLNYPAGVALDTQGNLYIGDRQNNRIREVTRDGRISTVAGNGNVGYNGDGGGATAAWLAFPAGVALDAQGNIYIAEMLGHRIRKVAPDGKISTVAGNGTAGYSGDGGEATAASLNYPEGVALDPQGSIYIADLHNNRVRKVTLVSCTFSLGATGGDFPATGGTGKLDLTTLAGCPWTATSDATAWLTITSGAAGSGSASVAFSVVSNETATARTGHLSIAGQTFTVTQAGASITCSCSLSSSSASVAAGSGSGSFSVTAGAGCTWTATVSSSVTWIAITSGASGSGNGTVNYTVAANTGGMRTGTITVAGQQVYVNQAASGQSVSSLASLNAGGIVNAASYSPPIASGAFVSIYGQNLADTTADWSAAIVNGKLPTSLGGVQVLINGKNAFICYVQATQVNALTPPDAATSPVEVDVITSHGTIPATVNLAALSPALFTYTLKGTAYAAAQFASDYAYVAPSGALPGASSRPAKPGDNILLYATGLGQTNPAYPVGQVLTGAYPVPDLSKVSVLIGGQPALVQFAGMTYAGLFQINVQVPNGIPAGDQPIVLGISGQASLPAVYLTFGGG